jgi:NADH dehydrogenase
MKIVIIGGGFGGLRLARKLMNKPSVEVLLVDRFNYHQFQPLFYQVATSGLDASNISFPFRKVFQNSKNVRYQMGSVKAIDTKAKTIKVDEETISYEALIISTGADTNFFGNENVEQHSFPMKSTVEALQIRHRLLSNFEEATTTDNPLDREKLMNIVIAGGGPTGVELSGAIAELRNDVLPKDYPELDFSLMNIHLLEGSPNLLGAMSEKSHADALRYLKKLGVEVHLNTLLSDYDGHIAQTKEGLKIPTAMMVWAAGVKGNVPEGIDNTLLARGNRIVVDRECKVAGLDNVFAIGDVSYMEEPAWPTGHPQVAPVAIQMADMLANNLLFVAKQSGKKQILQFEYNDKGAMATVGRNLAVVDIPKPKLHINGFLAWLIWMGLHLMLILGVKNRFAVFSNWLYNYFTRDQNLRLIFKAFYRER